MMKTSAWIILVAVLFVSTYGLSLCVILCTGVIALFVGGLSFAYIHSEDYTSCCLNELKVDDSADFTLKKIVELMQQRQQRCNLDNRFTGSHIIDEELQAILYYVFRDYVYPWYNKISDNEEFPNQLKETIYKMIVTVANRVKDVDWMPYLTTQLVDDVASHVRLYKQARAKMKAGNVADMENIFFDSELIMEHNLLCRDHICLNVDEEKNYMQHTVEALLYQVMPKTDFHCETLRFLTRELLTCAIFLPLVAKLSDPDFINRIIIWLCSDFPICSELFLVVLKTTNNIDELHATRNIIRKEISLLRCHDSGGDNDYVIKSQLASLLFVDKVIDMRLSRLQEGSDRDSTGVPSFADYNKLLSENKLIQLSLDFILKNNVALSYFIDYVTSISYQGYLYGYLNMEGWKLTAKREIFNIGTRYSGNEKLARLKELHRQLKDAAFMLCNQYFTEKASQRLNIDPNLLRQLTVRINMENPDSNWFDEIMRHVYVILEEKCLFTFRKNQCYIKLLAELELLKEPLGKSDDEVDVICADELNESSGYSPSKATLGNNDAGSSDNTLMSEIQEPCCNSQFRSSDNRNGERFFTLSAKIIETGLVQESGKSFGIYAVAVSKLFDNGTIESWHIYRRYSDFYELHQKLKEKFADLNNVPFPGKKAFNNMDRDLLEKRMKMLNNYMRILLQLGLIKSHPSLQNILLSFLEPGEYDRGVTGGLASKTVDNLLINPLKFVGNAMKIVPDNLLNTMDGVMEGFSKVFQKSLKPDEEESMKVGAVLDNESNDNVPLRIMLLLMTEVFDLKTRNQWLRRRIIQLLRQIMHAMFGDIVNKRILDYVAVITSPERVAKGIMHIRNSFWPNGVKNTAPLARDHDALMQTRVAAKYSLLASFPDDLKRILGSETSRTGLILVFSLFQHEVLNKRLVYVLLEGILVTLFPKIDKLSARLHANSPRMIAFKHNSRMKKL